VEEEQRRKEEEEQRQKNLAHRLKADRVAAVEQALHKNWMKTYLPPLSLPSNEEMNLIDLPPLTKRQHVCYLLKETPEARQQREELAREMGASIVSGGSPCERCANFGILCIPQKFAVSNFPLVNFVLNFFLLSHTISCIPCTKAKTAYKPFDADKARAKAKSEVARRSRAKKAKQQTDTE